MMGCSVGRFRDVKKSGLRGIALALGAALALGLAVAAPQAAVAAEDTALLEVHKFASEETLAPGETMEYRIEVGCSSISDLGCRGATLSDLIPAEFEIVPGSVTVTNATSLPPTVDGNQVTIEFTDDLGDGTVGLLENADAVITIQVRLREDLPHEANGTPIVNTAVANAENAGEVSDQVAVTPNVELKLGTEVTKEYSPKVGQANPGTPVQLTVDGSNASNAGVDTLTLTDPADPNASPNPFEWLEITGFDALTFPDGADTATVEYFIDGAWVAVEVPAGSVPPAPSGDAKGVRVTFTAADGSKIPAGAGGGFVLNLEQRPGVADLEESVTVHNTVESEVALGEETDTAGDSDDYTIVTEPISVGATKQFDPNVLIEGQETTVTLTGTNNSLTDLDTLSVREPVAPNTFAEELDFTGFTGSVQFPNAATAGTITIVYLDTNGAEQTFGPVTLTDGGAYPALPGDFGSLQYFTADFTGPITPGGSTEIQFTAEANDQATAGSSHTNVVGVEGVKDGDSATDEADDTVSFDEKKLEIVTEKKLSPEEIWGFEGEGVLVQLPTTVVKPGSNVPATEIVVSDPELSDPANPDSAPANSGFWDAFTPQAITNTDVPAGATLTVRYWDTEANEWKVIPGFDGLTGTVNQELPADILDKIGGIQFVFENPNPGFEPHEVGEFNVNPSFTATLTESRPVGSDPIDIANCASASGVAEIGGTPVADDQTDAPACDSVTVKAPTPGEYDLFWKSWEGAGNPAQIVQRSGDHATTRLHWATDGLTFDRMTIADTRLGTNVAAGPIDPVAQTSFEAFDLVAIKAVTEDAAFVAGWDRIAAIDLWIGGAWVPATNATGLPYTQTMTDIALTASEQRDATAVRLVFEENPAGRTGAGAPAIGSGITKSANRDRKIDLEWELRDVRRSDPGTAVIASEVFNVAGQEGLVKNWGSATGSQPGGDVQNDQDDDDITIVPRPLGVSVNKGWTGGPLGVPPADVPETSYPTSRATITATNTSLQKVDELSIAEPGDGKASPFEIFNLYRIVSVPNAVAGADPASTTVVLTKSDGTSATVTPSAATALSASELADVVKVELHHFGRIESDAKATLQLDFQLRKTHRSDPSTAVSVVDSPIKNEATGTVSDLVGLAQEHSVDEDAGAQIQLDTFDLAVATTKSFTPDHQRVEWLPGDAEHTAEQWEPIRMDLTARPSGTARSSKLVVTDSGENRVAGEASAKSFWNAYRFVGFSEDTLAVATPINRVQAEVLYGDFTGNLPGNRLDFTPDASTPDGDGWVPGTAAPVAVSGGKIENAAATLLALIPAGDYDKIRGIRLTYTRVDGSGGELAFENPANPQAKISLDVKRRAYLVSDPSEPVPDSNAAISAPGESVLAPGGLFTNTVDADAESFVKLPVEGSDDPLPLVVSDDASARVTYLAEGIEVAVEKTPVGAQQPGAVIPFKLKTTNTAKRSTVASENEELAIADPVILDYLPMANGKPQLVFDPDMDVDKRFSYELSNELSDNLSPMPIDPSKVTVTYLDESMNPITDGSDPAAIEFRFPDNTVLYPQESYTVTVNMMFRPGVLAGSENELTNRFGVTSDQVFNGCNFEADVEVRDCFADTSVYPTESGALRGKKYVRANDTELGLADVPNPNSGRTCVPQFGDAASGYSVSNCVPITKPLGVETWREELQNTGTLAMEKVVTIDSLPKVDDQGALVLLPRQSQWQPSWIGNTELVTATGPDGEAYRDSVPFELFYSSSDGAACTADLKPTEQQCAGFWLPLTADVDPTTVRHVKTVFDFSAAPLAPGERLAYTFETRTPAQSSKMTADTVAWNSVAVGAQTVTSDGRTKSSVIPTEGLRVGVALATGPLAVQKTVAGSGAEFAPDEFELEVLCTVEAPDGSGLSEQLDPVTVTVPAGEPVTLDEQFPWGAKCTVADVAGANGETSSVSGDPVTIGRDGDPVPLATLTNTYEVGSFQVAKAVTGATNQDGDPVDYGSFPVSAVCTFLGEELPLDPAQAELTAGGTAWLVDQLPVGAECTLTEDDAKGARASLTLDGSALAPNEDGSWSFTLVSDESDLSLVLQNDFPLGAISIEKQVTGDGAAAVSDDTVFTFSVLCILDGAPVWDGTVELTKGDAVAGTSKLIDTLPYGASCSVTETGTGGATSSTLTPDTSEEPIAVGPQEFPVAFTAVNTYDAGALHVTKEITGAGAELWGAGPFEVSLACTIGGAPVDVPGGAERALTSAGGLEADYTGLPAGAECELTETTTGGATASEIVDAAGDPVSGPVTVGAGDTVALRVINTFDIGAITVTKEITGAGASLAADRVFTVALACSIDRDGTPTEIEVPGGATRELSRADGLTASYEQLPVGAACELRETKTGGAESVTITPNTGDATVGTVTVAAGAAAQVTVVNEFAATPPGPGTPGTPGTPGGTGLPTTGGAAPTAWLLGAGALALLGAALLVLRARRRGDAA
ncbi:putative repeat protein (TIGR01451 family) [Leucobacter luti]|uniref:Putative repeat protein (TIGR01451 family) n=1 Tax=Leucobacter luti TaxID=340320 RepID=A0A4Q7U1H1_9MICO|nr:putative repeat protein (TIGR01451 family) [Leucobacter luti]